MIFSRNLEIFGHINKYVYIPFRSLKGYSWFDWLNGQVHRNLRLHFWMKDDDGSTNLPYNCRKRSKALYPLAVRFRCDVCSCSLVTRHTDNEPLFCLVALSICYTH